MEKIAAAWLSVAGLGVVLMVVEAVVAGLVVALMVVEAVMAGLVVVVMVVEAVVAEKMLVAEVVMVDVGRLVGAVIIEVLVVVSGLKAPEAVVVATDADVVDGVLVLHDVHSQTTAPAAKSQSLLPRQHPVSKNAKVLITVPVPAIVSDVNAVQPENAYAPIVDNPFGILMAVNFVQPSKARKPIELNSEPGANMTDSSKVKRKNVYGAIVLTVAGMATLFITGTHDCLSALNKTVRSGTNNVPVSGLISPQYSITEASASVVVATEVLVLPDPSG